MKNCKDCGLEYNEDNLEIPVPIPDGMCSTCGNLLTESQIQELINKAQELENKQYGIN